MKEGEIKILSGGFIDNNEDGGHEKRARKRTALERFLDIFITVFSTVSIRIKKKTFIPMHTQYGKIITLCLVCKSRMIM